MITRESRWLEGGITPKLLASVIAEHLSGAERYAKLKRYYQGKTDILNRKRGEGFPNNRVAHAFARYIVTVTSGYLAGEAIGYEAEGCDERALEAAKDILASADSINADAENARACAIYGKGVELIAMNSEGRPGIYPLPPESAFVVYDADIAYRPLFGVYLTSTSDETGSFEALRALVVTDTRFIAFEKREKAWIAVEETPHFFGAVPMVEYWNDENEAGDFEWVIPLIDAYDRLQSDRVNDKEQFTDKLLVLTGCTMDTDEDGRPPWLQLRLNKALCLPDGDAKAQYLSAQMDESGNEILRASIENDIHKLSMVPDISDAHFAGNASGVAMKYKLLALEQLAGLKQRWFEEGLRSRLKLISGWLALRGYPLLDVNGVRLVFRRRLPEPEE